MVFLDPNYYPSLGRDLIYKDKYLALKVSDQIKKDIKIAIKKLFLNIFNIKSSIYVKEYT